MLVKNKVFVGQVFGRLTVLKIFRKRNARGRNVILCSVLCDCGTYKTVIKQALVSGNTTSCGCFHREAVSKLFFKHGCKKDRLYTIWSGIKKRCNNKNAPNFKYYGKRGISVCKDWSNNFLSFQKWAIENGYKDNLQIDRTNNDGNYEPGNCRWVSSKVNCRNRKSNVVLSMGGETKTAVEWSEELGLKCSTIYSRVNLGWSDEEILTNLR